MNDAWPDGTLGIYVITRNDPDPDYDEVSGFVIAAVDEESARTMIADEEVYAGEGAGTWLDSRCSTAVMAGRSLPGDPPRVILRDFRAGLIILAPR
jgi:hypothetical protein